MSQYARYIPFGGGGGGGGSVNSVTASSPLFSSGGANPNITIQVANGSQNGYLSAADWTTFNNKQNALTFGNLTDVGTDGITITGGTGAVIGSGTSISQHVADATHNGYLSSVDWNTFNNKQAALTFTAPLVNTANVVSINGTIADNKLNFANAADPTKLFTFDLGSMSTGASIILQPLSTANETYNIPPLVDSAGTLVVQNNTSGQVFIGATASIGGANSGIQYSNATTANRGQIRLGSYVNATSVAGVTTATSRSGTVGVNAAVVVGQDYSKWTAQAGATTPGSLPISGTFAFKANTVNSLTVTSDYHIQLTNLAGTLGDRLYLGSEGALQLPNYSTGYAHFDSSGNILSFTATQVTADLNVFTSLLQGLVPASGGGTTNFLRADGTWSPAGTGTVTSVTASAPLSSSGGTTPNITISQSTTSTDGYLSSVDWNTFNNKHSFIVNKFTLTPTDITNKFVTLTQAPAVPSQTSLDIIGGIEQDYGPDFTVSGTTLSWSGLFLDGVLSSGDKLIIYYY